MTFPSYDSQMCLYQDEVINYTSDEYSSMLMSIFCARTYEEYKEIQSQWAILLYTTIPEYRELMVEIWDKRGKSWERQEIDPVWAFAFLMDRRYITMVHVSIVTILHGLKEEDEKEMFREIMFVLKSTFVP